MTARLQQSALSPPRKNSTLADMVRFALRSNSLDISVAFPGTVKKFDSVTNLLDVEVDFSDVLQLDMGEQVLTANILTNILLSNPGEGKSGGGYLTFPVNVGDKGHVTVFDRSVDRWIERGEGGDPQFRHTHNRIDGVFTPGLRDKSRAIGVDYDQTAAVLEHDSVKLGALAVLAAARQTDSVSAGTTIVPLPAMNMVTWIGIVTASLAALGIAITTPIDFGDISSGSSKVKIE